MFDKRHKNYRQCGFSYVETVMALVVGSIVTAMAIPASQGILQKIRSNGDAREVSGSIALAKLRAAAAFTHARVYADRDAKTIQLQIWDRSGGGAWVTEGPVQSLASGVSFGYGSLTTPPANTQASLSQAPTCQTDAETNANSAGTITGTSCVIFNSRGTPVDNTGTATGNYALYVTDLSSIYGVTVSATGVVRTWRTDIRAANWARR